MPRRGEWPLAASGVKGVLSPDTTKGLAIAAGVMSVNNWDTGSWTPSIVGSVTPGVQTYTYQVGSYLRIGQFCFIAGALSISAVDAAISGVLRITGLPFASAGSGSLESGISISRINGFTLAIGGGTWYTLRIQSGESFIRVTEQAGGLASQNAPVATMSASSLIGFSGVYTVA